MKSQWDTIVLELAADEEFDEATTDSFIYKKVQHHRGRIYHQDGYFNVQSGDLVAGVCRGEKRHSSLGELDQK